MENFILELTTGGNKFKITKEEANAIISASENQSVVISRLNISIPKRMAIIYPEHSPDMIEDKKNQTTGRLHDGTRVRRHFGEWIVDEGLVPDDRGNYVPVRLSREYYPEVALDMVPTEQKYEKIKHLPLAERKKLICGERVERIESQEPKQLKDIL